jgi:hippurate hydrolase
VRAHLLEAVERMATAAGQLHGAGIEFSITGSTPPVRNPPEIVAIAEKAAEAVVGGENVCPLEVANMGAEDFGWYLQQTPGCYVRFGSQVPGREGYPAHSSRFDVDEEVLRVGAAYYHRVATIAGERI